MALVKRKQRKVRARARTGIAAAPIDKGYDAVKYYFHMELDRKDLAAVIKTYIKRVYNKKDAAAILANPDYKFTAFSHYSCIAFWMNSELPQDEKLRNRADFYKFFTEHDNRRNTNFLATYPEMINFWQQCEEAEALL